ncbi:CcdB family protein [Paraglaciecola aquimarina]|uniref:Toxin CcdB n=1 Tax=Paraglaciecola algarum TaxID=3050085 RepID=A0ABS9D8I7_9ALTE|nr:CcdB family protein [Paraglaciecola sp. G1-23]MCF2947981.1 CcdB family protein [Paraglaciecola sp. G1-23]
MNKFDVYRNRTGAGYILDVQTDLLSGLNTRVVVPLIQLTDSPKPAKYLNPIFTVDGEEFVMLTQFIASIPESELSQPIANIDNCHHEINTALDMIFSGF